MCGIGGILTKDSGLISASEVEVMASALYHRGPDDQGFLSWDGDSSHSPENHRHAQALGPGRLLFMHRRLSIIDVGDGGWQPMLSSDGRFAIVFNGEIYNYRELRRELNKQGYIFRSDSDTEVLLAALIIWGEAALRRLNGMFAFAFLDIGKRRMLFARDPFGMKPLYYVQTKKSFMFASEIKALLEVPMISRCADAQQVYNYLRNASSDTGETTFFSDVKQLPPAHWMALEIDNPDHVVTERYWVPGSQSKSELGFEDAAEQLRSLFLESVKLHLRSDVPVGAALSGGIDSSSTVAAMQHLAGGKLSLHTFSYIADDTSLNEEEWVNKMGKAVGAHIHKACPTPNELADDLDSLIKVHDEPFASTSVYAQYRVFQLAKQHGIKVTLDGQGADEYLAGYPVFTAARAASMLMSGRIFPAFDTIIQGSKNSELGLQRMSMRMIQHALPARLLPLARQLIGEKPYLRGLNRKYFQRADITTDMQESRGAATETMRNLLIETLTRTSLPALLRYADRNSMAFSVESRLPFLNVALVDFILTLPECYLIDRSCMTKAIFRCAMRGLVPDSILNRRDKIGFETPQDAWLSAIEPWVERRLGAASEVLPVNAPSLRDDWQAAMDSKRTIPGYLWRSLNLIRWAECYDVKFA